MSWLPIELLKAASMDKVVNSRLLNRAGIQVARTIIAHGIHGSRSVPLRGAASAAQLEALDRDGIVAIPDFLPEDVFRAVKDEALGLLGTGKPIIYNHGPNLLHVRSVSTEDAVPALRQLANHPVLRDLFDWGERMTVDFRDIHFAVEALFQGEGEAKDLETELHSDIFFHTHKGWLYVDDVTEDNAPFVYVKGSHLIPRERLRFEYEHSCSGDLKSRRVTREECEARGLVETVCLAKANTLVVANVCGYHRRLKGVAGRRRCGVHFSHRRNPFLPRAIGAPGRLPGADFLRRVRDGRRSDAH